MKGSEWTMTLTISNGFDTYSVGDIIDEDVLISGMSPRLREEMSMAAAVGLSAVSFDKTVEMVKRKEFRRKAFVDEMRRLGGRLADHMEDREGWHGIDRSDAALTRAKSGS